MGVIPQQEQGALGAEPWHATPVVEAGGVMRTVQRYNINVGRDQLICRDGWRCRFRTTREEQNLALKQSLWRSVS